MIVTGKKIVIGSRGSKLAMWQTNHVAALLREKFGVETEIVRIKTTGDKILDSPLAKIGSKGLFVKEIEVALLEKRIDLAVHSAKDVPTELPEDLMMAAFLKREDPRDAIITRNDRSFKDLSEGAVVATSSLRRRAQLLHFRPDIKPVDVRGNVDTRVRKMNEGQFDAIVLALAGLRRMGKEENITEIFSSDIMLPAVGQGSIAVECRKDDKKVRSMLESIAHRESMIAVTAERALMKRLQGGCQVPIGALAAVSDGEIKLDAMIASLDGKKYIRRTLTGSSGDPDGIGIELADKLLSLGGREILDKIRAEEGMD